MKRTLTEKHAPDRLRMFAELQAMASEHGCAVERIREDHRDWSAPRTRLLKVAITTPVGLSGMLEFDGQALVPDMYLVSWHVEAAHAQQLDSSVFPGMVNPHHKRKATTFSDGFDELRDTVAKVFALAVSNKVFRLPELRKAA
jgi:hypothetical protein